MPLKGSVRIVGLSGWSRDAGTGRGRPNAVGARSAQQLLANSDCQSRSSTAGYRDSVAGHSRLSLAPCIPRHRLLLLTSAVVNALEKFSSNCRFILLGQRCGRWTRPAKRCLSGLCSANVRQSELPESKQHSRISRLCWRAKPSVVGSMHPQTPVAAADQRCRQCP